MEIIDWEFILWLTRAVVNSLLALGIITVLSALIFLPCFYLIRWYRSR